METDYTFEYEWYLPFNGGGYDILRRITKSKYPNTVYNQIFPGFLDRGSPLIIQENKNNKYVNKNTIVGIFRENLAQGNPGPAIFDRLYPEIVNWIVETAEWTQDSDETNKYLDLDRFESNFYFLNIYLASEKNSKVILDQTNTV